MRYGSVCSGIEAASVAWMPLGWTPAWYSEIEPFPCAVLAHHHPSVPNHGDMTTLPSRVLSNDVEAPDVLVGGTPCQSFSVAGLRAGLSDPRGQLTRTYVELLDAIDLVRARRGQRSAVAVWENVPGVLSDTGNAFGNFLAALVGEGEPLVAPGGRWTNAGVVSGPARVVAWRVLDAQYFGVAQRRRRVFLVAGARASGVDPVSVLLVEHGVQRHSPPSREAGQRPAHTLAARTRGGGGLGTDFDLDGGLVRHDGGQGVAVAHVDVLPTMVSGGSTQGSHNQLSGQLREQYIVPHVVAPPLTAAQADVAHPEVAEVCGTLSDGAHNGGGLNGQDAYTGRILPVAFDTTQITSALNRSAPKSGDPCHPLAAGAHVPAIAFHPTQDPITSEDGTTHCLGTGSKQGTATVAVAAGMAVRRLMPVECERLQGFPDDYTRIPWKKKPASECPDGPRYKALGNAMAVPCMAWIGRRIATTQETP